jgi:hypothetical protein
MSALIDVERAVADWLLTVLPGRTLVKRDDSDAGAPAGPCVVYSATATTAQGRPRHMPDDTVTAPHEVRVALSLLGANALTDAGALVLSLYATRRTADLYRVAGLLSHGQPQDRTALELATMQARADLEVVLSAHLSYSVALESIDTVGISTPSATFTVTRGVDPHGC